jgi:glycosyltransferase involved in cell wall biosynthesis
VAVWRDSFAPYSETFIYDELRHHVRWDATVFAAERLNADRFPWPDVVTLQSEGLGRIEQLGYRATGLSPTMMWHARRGRFDLIHAHFGTAGVRALPYAVALGLPLITMFHGGDLSRLFGEASRQPRNWPMRAAGPLLLRRSAVVLAASTDLFDNLVEVGCPRDKLRIFRLGIDLTQFRRERGAEASKHIVMVGRLVEKKGFEYALQAIAGQPEGGPPLRVSIAGDGPLRDRLATVAQDLGLQDRVTFLGALPHAEIKHLMSTADVVLAPSVVTPSGDRDSGIIVVKEAAASRVPSIGTYHGGIPEIIDDGTTGFLVAEHDVTALADRLRRILGDEVLRQRLGDAARAKMEREYDIVQRVAALEDIYDEVVARHRGHD